MEGARGVQVVWLKRDLRVVDHEPLARAAAAGPVLVLYVDEPSVLASPQMAQCHQDFIDECLAEIDAWCRFRGGQLIRRVGAVVDVLEQLHSGLGISHLWSHEETGYEVTYARDRAVGAWSRAAGVPWSECRQNGVVRALRSRNGWARQWQAAMAAAPLPEVTGIALVTGEQVRAAGVDDVLDQISVPDRAARAVRDRLRARGVELAGPSMPRAQRGGERAAHAVLESFTSDRARGYRGGISAPLRAEINGSRLSPYLAWGAISPRTVLAATRARQKTADARTRAGLTAMESRMAWRDHFTQKLEDEPRIETACVHRGFEAMRPRTPDAAGLQAWRDGETGYPLVDAVQRCLAVTGFVNFRMRAMVTSFAAYHLWLDWRALDPILARRFLDWEPGIHVSQLQMQSGVTGINAIRIYNPVKQAYDQDAEGSFIKRWVPELGDVPPMWIAEPHRMDASLQSRFNVSIGSDYPQPIVDNAAAMAQARALVHAWRDRPDLQAEARRVRQRHASRAGAAARGTSVAGAEDTVTPTRPRRRTPKPPPAQGQLDF
ncbi:MAG: deoxyribodipyrimidine photo-lyase [Thermoleophilia bacterium]|nr:deoxyribodipyrimidine photo-lyase [Thermoleophilia bacterium]